MNFSKFKHFIVSLLRSTVTVNHVGIQEKKCIFSSLLAFLFNLWYLRLTVGAKFFKASFLIPLVGEAPWNSCSHKWGMQKLESDSKDIFMYALFLTFI